LHSRHEPVQPTTLSVLHRGQRASLEAIPHDGQMGTMVI
jgi:hypothetical protein